MSNQKKLRIAVCDLVTSFGGVQRVMVNLLPELAKQFDICVVDPYANANYAEKLCKVNVQTYFTAPSFKKAYIGGEKTWRRVFNLSLAIPRIIKIRCMFARAIAEINPDYIYVNQLSALRLLGSVRGLRGIPFIYHAHGYAKASDISASAVRFINTRVNTVIAVSHSTADVLHQAGIRQDIIHVCHNAVPIEEIERRAQLPVSKPLPRKQPEQVVFLLPATIQYIKGQHLAIDALAHLVEKGRNVALWFAGDVATGGNRKYLEGLHRKVDKLGIAHLVHFLGWRDDIYQLMTAADVVMLCSLTDSESFGMALAEALVLSKPCIGASIGGIPEVIADKHTGLLFTPGLADSLADAMALLATNTEMRDNFGRVGRRRVEELFTVAVQASRIGTIINIMTT